MDALGNGAYITQANVTEAKLTIRRNGVSTMPVEETRASGGATRGLEGNGVSTVEAEETRALKGSTQEGKGVSTMAAEETRASGESTRGSTLSLELLFSGEWCIAEEPGKTRVAAWIPGLPPSLAQGISECVEVTQVVEKEGRGSLCSTHCLLTLLICTSLTLIYPCLLAWFPGLFEAHCRLWASPP